MSDTYDLIMAAYRGTEAAGRDFDALAVLVRDRQIASEGLTSWRRTSRGA